MTYIYTKGDDVSKVFIDGKAGTTGLRIEQRLAERQDIELIQIEDEFRKDLGARLECIAAADVTILCLPDEDAKEIAAADEKSTIIDCSTAHRTAEGWTYGLPELFSGIADAKRISNPGCYATGFIMTVKPLVDAGIIGPDAMLSCHALSGYSGGGKSMIADYEACGKRAPVQYALSQEHKHLPEMHKYSGLDSTPVFSPVVCDFYSGMLVSVPLKASKEAALEALAGWYEYSPLVKVSEAAEGNLQADALAGRDDIEIFVTGKGDRIEIVSRYDNLGKGASGAAIQNMNILLGLPEETGLVTGA